LTSGSSNPFFHTEDGDSYLYYHQAEAFQKYLEQLIQMRKSQMEMIKKDESLHQGLYHNYTDEKSLAKLKAM
jgi:negative regulator of sigma E activity